MKKAFRLRRWLVCLALAGVVSCQTTWDPAPIPAAPSGLPEHLILGNPSGVVTDMNQPTNYLLAKP